MKKLITIIGLSLFSFTAFSQETDLSDEETIKFLENNEKIYEPIKRAGNVSNIIEKSLPEELYSLLQIEGYYNFTHNFNSWMIIYHDIQKSYFEQDKYPKAIDLYKKFVDKVENYDYEGSTWDEVVKYPFALTIHEVNKFKPKGLETGLITMSNNQLYENNSPEKVYSKFIMKSATILEQYPSDFPKGQLLYDEDFISLGDNIHLNSLMIDVGYGPQLFDVNNPVIHYDRNQDSIIANVYLDYKIDEKQIKDTIAFYLTSGVDKKAKGGNEPNDKASVFTGGKHTYTATNMKFRYGIIWGCNNTNKKLKRPVLILPPYRPGAQPKTLKSYYNKYNDISSWIEYLVEKDYDVIIIKEKSGHESIELAGDALAEWIEDINTQKQADYPNEDWENVIFGFSAGGQHVRYALMQMEKDHMDNNSPHHHTKLYGAFDSPHLGANVPMGTQGVYHDKRFESILAQIAWTALNDAASRDMLRYHISGNMTNAGGGDRIISATPHIYRTNLVNEFNNNFIHTYTSTGDMRKTFPTFSRNIAVSTGSYSQNYQAHSGLTPGMTLFSQYHNLLLTIGERHLKSMKYGFHQSVYRREFKHWPYIYTIKRNYKIDYFQELDGTNGGWQPTFYEGIAGGPIAILTLPNPFNLGYISFKYYHGHLNFMPLVSALAINENIWASGASADYNPRANNLMYQTPTSNSTFFGYPNIKHPTNHFNITPFEAVFADNGTFRHIDMLQSINSSVASLPQLRQFLMDEIEADVVKLQNKVIGQNNNISSSHVYKAWYKAEDAIHIGHSVTYKTDPGDYIIQDDGDITTHAKNEIIIKPGFHAQYGSDFHAFIYYDDCNGGNKAVNENTESNHQMSNTNNSSITLTPKAMEEESLFSVYPNPTDGMFYINVINNITPQSYIEITNLVGITVYSSLLNNNTTSIDISDQPNGIYLIKLTSNDKMITKKIIKQ
ncbi:MAG TPA: T9SS type A sorting domain-containing protein [Vicingaceae bacterium]